MSGLELFGWGWPAIGGAFALTASALVLLYLVRLRRRVVTVPFVALFRDVLPDERSTRLFTRLKNLLSLLLVLVVAALIALALGQPRLAERRGEARTHVFVLDTSASMQARDATGVSRFDRARDAALARLAVLGVSDSVLVLATGGHTEVISPLSTEHALARRALQSLSPTDAPGDAREALAWSTSLCGAARELQATPQVAPCVVEIFTDGGLAFLPEARAALEAAGVESEVHPLDHDARDNIAITALSARRFPADPSRAELLVEITSAASSPTTVTLSISADGQLAHRETLTLAPSERLQRTLDGLTGADALIEARLTHAEPARALDALAIDDVAWARLAPRRRRRVLLVSPAGDPNVYLEAALLLDPYLDVATLTPEAYEAQGAPTDRELAIFDRHTPSTPPSVPSLLLAPSGAPWLPVGEPIPRPRFDTQSREHPLLRFVALREVNIGSARPLVPQPGDEVVAAEARGALLTTGTRAESTPHLAAPRFVALGFDVRESDLPLRIAWPILVLDAIAYLLPDDLTLAPSAHTGRAFRLALPTSRLTSPPTSRARLVRRSDGALTASLDEREVELLAREGVAEIELDRAGVYDVVTEAGTTGRTVVANLFSREESDLVAATTDGTTAGATDDTAQAPDADALTAPVEDETSRWPLHVILVAAALALLAVEWFTFHRRWTT